jgi:hypothetical protein
MKTSLVASLALAVVGLSFAPQDPGDMAKEMEKAKKWMEPGKNHDVLKKFIGSWTTSTRFFFGDKASPAAAGTAEGDWLMEGRWVRFEARGAFMGKALHSYAIVGYDNFKQSFAMVRTEGDLDQSGKSLITYGTLDEYLTGEHDKAIKVAWRFESDDKFTMEIHDFAIGESGTKVIEVVHTRKK